MGKLPFAMTRRIVSANQSIMNATTIFMYPDIFVESVIDWPRSPTRPPRTKYEASRPTLKCRSGLNFCHGVSAWWISLCFAASARRSPPVTARQLLVPATRPMTKMPPMESVPDVEGASDTRSKAWRSL